MNWTEPRKSEKSSEQNFSASKKIQTTCLNTPLFDKEYKSGKYEQPSLSIPQIKHKNCPYHFNTQDHVCLTCRKSICVRCAITYCQNHTIKQQKQIIPTLVEDLHKIFIRESIDQIQTKLGQSLQRQDYFQNKILKLIEKAQENFSMVIEKLNRKKLQIVSYFDQQFQKYLNEYRDYDQILKKKLIWLNGLDKEWALPKFQSVLHQNFTIQKIDQLSAQIREDTNIIKTQKKLNNIMLGKNKLCMQKLWSEEHLQKLLYEIENIPFRMCKELIIPQMKTLQKKKRIITQSSQHQSKPMTSTHKSPIPKNLKGSGRIIYNKFNSGRKNKEQRLQKSQLL